MIDSYRCHDLTVPFPTAAISNTDPFGEYDASPFPLEVDDTHIVKAWSRPDMGLTSSMLDSATKGDGQSTDEQGEEVLRYVEGDVTITVKRHVRRTDATGVLNPAMRGAREMALGQAGQLHRRPRLPPIFFARYPFTYVSLLRCNQLRNRA